jgi:hypothetical protein
MSQDIRYEYVHCACCSNAYQLIDFRGNPHAWACPRPAWRADDIGRLQARYPQVRFQQ